MTDADIRQTFEAISELVTALKNAVRPPGPANSWQWDSYFNSRIDLISAAATPPLRDESGKFKKVH